MNLKDIKKLHDKGFALIYLRQGEKRPIESGWTSQTKKTWGELENSFEKTHNLGVRLGLPSRLISGNYLGAIDCDVKSQSRKAKLEMNEALRTLGIDLDKAPVVMSGRGNGSKHVYVQTKEPMQPLKFAQSSILSKVKMPSAKPSRRDLEKLTSEEIEQGLRIRPAWEIAFMGTGQQTVLPPSIHPDTGFKYAWANDMQVKHLPLFKPEMFVSQVSKKLETIKLDFKAEDVNLYDSNLPIKTIKLIESGQGSSDKSADLFSIALSMCRFGFSDNQILSVLSDPTNWISSAGYAHTQSNSRLRAVHWINKYTLTKARYETDIMRKFENKPTDLEMSTSDAKEVKADLEDQDAKILPDLDGKNKPRPTLRNLLHILEKFMGGGAVGYDEFSNRAVFLKDTVYGGIKGNELTDQDDLHLKVYCAAHYRFEPSKEICYEAHAVVSKKYAFHPVKSYLDGLTWDKTPRLDQWLKSAFRAYGPDQYLEAVGRKVLVAAVARVYEPGVKFDHVMVLEGFQGKGKSTALRILAGDKWFTDGLGDIHQKDVVDQMTGKWLIELGELASIKKADVDLLKSFITRQTDRVRMPYGRRSADFPRQSIFIGSTNLDEYFTDETGNRRYWPVKIDQANFKWLVKNRDQLWAEAKVQHDLGESLYFEKEVEELARIEQSKRFAVDEIQGGVLEIMKDHPSEKYTSTEIWRKLNGTIEGHPSDYESRRIAKVMKVLGFTRKNMRIGGVVMKGWRRYE